MKREILYRFFEGASTLEEETQIREWVESSLTDSFMKSRKEYDALILSGASSYPDQRRTVSIFRRLVAISAAVVAY